MFQEWFGVCVKYSIEVYDKNIWSQNRHIGKEITLKRSSGFDGMWQKQLFGSNSCSRWWNRCRYISSKGKRGTIGFQPLSSSPSPRALQSPLPPSSYFSPRIPSLGWHKWQSSFDSTVQVDWWKYGRLDLSNGVCLFVSLLREIELYC